MNVDLAKLPRVTLAAIVLFLIAVGGAGGWSWQQRGEAEKAERRWRMRQMQWRGLSGSQPAPVAAVAEDLAAQVAQAEQAVRKLRQQLGATGKDPIWAEDPPAQRADAFFALARFMEDQRASAARSGVEVPDNAAFSFSAHRNSGPPDEHLAVVHRQMLVVDRLLNILWTARPERLIAVQRERPAAKLPVDEASAANASRAGRAEDWFDWPAGRSLAREGILDTLALRVSFVGRTAALRGFMAGLSAADTSMVVREVAVRPLGANGQASGGRRTLEDLFRDETAETSAEATNAVPIIAANDAEFSVTVEYLDFVGPAQRRAAEADPEDMP